jgi:hypothetical protein
MNSSRWNEQTHRASQSVDSVRCPEFQPGIFKIQVRTA